MTLEGDELSEIKYERDNDSALVARITPDFVDNMLRLGQILNGHLWGVRFDGDKMILIVSRFQGVFEISWMCSRRSLKYLDKDLQEFVDILSIVSQMEFIDKKQISSSQCQTK